MPKKYAEIRVEGNDEDLAAFGTFAAFVNGCRRLGTCRTISITVDGDGSASLNIMEKNLKGEWETILFEGHDLSEAIKTWENNDLWIGE